MNAKTRQSYYLTGYDSIELFVALAAGLAASSQISKLNFVHASSGLAIATNPAAESMLAAVFYYGQNDLPVEALAA